MAYSEQPTEQVYLRDGILMQTQRIIEQLNKLQETLNSRFDTCPKENELSDTLQYTNILDEISDNLYIISDRIARCTNFIQTKIIKLL
jgi:hypothetical protein